MLNHDSTATDAAKLRLNIRRVEILIYAFDFAMWLQFHYAGQSLDSKVKLVDGNRSSHPDDVPCHATSALIDKFCVNCNQFESLMELGSNCGRCGGKLVSTPTDEWTEIRFFPPGLLAGSEIAYHTATGLLGENGSLDTPVTINAIYKYLRSLILNISERLIDSQGLAVKRFDDVFKIGKKVKEHSERYSMYRQHLVGLYNQLVGAAGTDSQFMSDCLRKTIVRHFGLPIKAPQASESLYCFRKSGASYQIRFENEAGDIPSHLLGAQYLHTLVENPNQSLSAIELRGGASSSISPQSEAKEMEESIRYLRSRAEDVEETIEQAKLSGDDDRYFSALNELTEIQKEISRNSGIGGRARAAMKSPEEAARSSVTQAIRTTIKKCKTHYSMPKLAKHLETSIVTGQCCSYRPHSPIPDWEL